MLIKKRDLHLPPLQLIGTTHAEPHRIPARDAAVSTAGHRRPVHAVVTQLNKSHRRSGQASGSMMSLIRQNGYYTAISNFIQMMYLNYP